MPMNATLHNTIFGMRCSKCKKTEDPIYHTQHGKIYKTCNECRARDARRRTLRIRDNLSPEFLAHLARVQPMSRRTLIIPPDTDTDTSSVDSVPVRLHLNPVDAMISLGFKYNDMDAVLALSSSAAAASSSSSGYFVEEPDPEPEPEGP